MYHYTDGGLRNVYLVNGYEIKQTPHGKAVVIHNLDGLVAAICRSLTRKGKTLTGTELRYIRSAGLLLSQESLGKMMGVDTQTVARWEKTGRVPKMADKLVRLLYCAKADGNEPIKQAIDRVNTVERLVNGRIGLKEVRGGWKETALEDEAVAA